MFDIDGGKLLIIGIVALVVIGPKELPGVLRQIGQAVAKMRRMASEFQGQFMDAMRESELDELRKDVTKMAEIDLKGLDPLDPLRKDMEALKADVDSALDPRVLESAPASNEMNGLEGPPVEAASSTTSQDLAAMASPPEAALDGPMQTPAPIHAPEPVPAPTPASGGHA